MAENYITYQEEKGNIHISEDVIAVIVGAAATEVEGVAGLSNTIGVDLVEFLGKKSLQKGIKIQIDEDKVVVDTIIMIRYGYGVTTVAQKVQEAVFAAVESMTGLTVKVNVHVNGVAFEK